MKQLPSAAEPGKRAMADLSGTAEELTQAASEVENLKKQFLEFFSITNSI
jgi:hypothetical protein